MAYKDIFGVHHFKNQLMKPATYRYTRHMYSQLDNREIWSLLYDIGEVEKIGRIMMTGSAAFWHEFSLRLPDRVAIPQEEVICLCIPRDERKTDRFRESASGAVAEAERSGGG